ncbi:MAG: hypothetical protein AAFQ63_23920 [Cyanobacteria bacterium J06621_11]
MPKGRPGGNPDIGKEGWRHQWLHPCSQNKSLRISKEMNSAIKAYLPDWQEICRRAIAENLPADVAKELGWPFEEE